MKNQELANIREEYEVKSLDMTAINKDPFQQFDQWFNESLSYTDKVPNAMTLATTSTTGQPSARIVLLKGVDTGFIFYTNYDSQKGQELIANPLASLLFFWSDMERQIRIEGRVEKLNTEMSDAYFAQRPKASQLGAIASPQSAIIPNRTFLEENYSKLELQHKDKSTIDRPANWGGFRVIPTKIEFWQGRSSRLHDRICYTLSKNGAWKIERLAP